MKFKVNNINKRLIEVTIDEVSSGVLDNEEAKELALHLIYVASELLELESKK